MPRGQQSQRPHQPPPPTPGHQNIARPGSVDQAAIERDKRQMLEAIRAAS